jgi:hypothetical protein
MPDPDPAQPTRRPGRPRGPRRSADAARRLETARRRNLEQLAAQRAREQAIDEALTTYITAEDAIHQAKAARDARIAPLQDRIAALTTQTEHQIEALHHQQAEAARAIHAAGRTTTQLAELLNLPHPITRQLLATTKPTPKPPTASD